MSARKCVICGKPQDEKYRPFCSKRCADVDLNRWFSGGYAIPAEDQSDDSSTPPERPTREE
ncbi:MAG TPA: DNA gyrase inhibitor YacG [Candidatus Binatia bacterium]|nr:DNA gyrase inhibitor YacG [Candidatus Binatia bacterium]